jgi:hypothetical protein
MSDISASLLLLPASQVNRRFTVAESIPDT